MTVMWRRRFIKKTLFRVYFYLNVGQKVARENPSSADLTTTALQPSHSTSGAAKMHFSRREIKEAAVFENQSKEQLFFSKFKHAFCEKLKNKKIYPKEWSRKHIFHPHFFIFLRNPKSMLKFLQNSLRNGMVQEIMDKEVSLSVKMHFSVSGHVTLGVVRWRHDWTMLALNIHCPNLVQCKHTCAELQQTDFSLATASKDTLMGP